jgi:hypothetical protein
MPSIQDKLSAFNIPGIRRGPEISPPAPKTKSGFPIEEILEGRWIETRRGDAFVVEQTFELDYRHGIASLRLAAALDTLAAWAADPRLATLRPADFAYLDTETTGLAGGTGTSAFLVGVGRYINDQFIFKQFFLNDLAEEPALLEALADFIAPCKALVTFNGKAFDAPLLVTRYTLNDIPVPFKNYSHVDLLPLARRLWRDRLPSRALKYLEEHVMAAPRTTADVPGFEIPELYFDFLSNGDARPLKAVFYHNAMDVVALAALFSLCAEMLANPHHTDLEHGQDVIALAKLFEDLNRWDDAAILYERGLQIGLPEADLTQAVKRLSILQRRRGDLETALKLWEQAAAKGHLYAHVELAKYYEHTRKDLTLALRWTLSALDHAKESGLPATLRKQWTDELKHRLKRLEGKVKTRKK